MKSKILTKLLIDYKKQINIYYKLFLLQVKHGCDLDLWSEGPGKCEQTLLHRAIDENNETMACFLIKR